MEMTLNEMGRFATPLTVMIERPTMGRAPDTGRPFVTRFDVQSGLAATGAVVGAVYAHPSLNLEKTLFNPTQERVPHHFNEGLCDH